MKKKIVPLILKVIWSLIEKDYDININWNKETFSNFLPLLSDIIYLFIFYLTLSL